MTLPVTCDRSSLVGISNARICCFTHFVEYGLTYRVLLDEQPNNSMMVAKTMQSEVDRGITRTSCLGLRLSGLIAAIRLNHEAEPSVRRPFIADPPDERVPTLVRRKIRQHSPDLIRGGGNLDLGPDVVHGVPQRSRLLSR
jgi:hypothetical protein